MAKIKDFKVEMADGKIKDFKRVVSMNTDAAGSLLLVELDGSEPMTTVLATGAWSALYQNGKAVDVIIPGIVTPN